MKTLIAMALALAAALGAAALYWSGERPVPVDIAVVERADVVDELTTNGRIEAGQPFDVYAETAGRVVRVVSEAGETVQKGAVLAVIDDGEAQTALAGARARMESAQAELALYDVGPGEDRRAEIKAEMAAAEARRRALRDDLETTRRLIASDAAPQAEALDLERRIEQLDRDVARLRDRLLLRPSSEGRRRLEARVREARAEVDRARRRAAAARIRSPSAGAVYALPLRPGDYVRPGDRVARIAGSAQVNAVLFVDEPELGRVELGRQVTLTADAYPEQAWTCTLERLPTEVVSLETRRVGEVLCGVEGEAQRLIPNLTVSARIPGASAANVPSLPREAVQGSGDATWAWTASADSRARRTAFAAGLRGDRRIEVRSGLEVGDEALLPGAEPLVEGQLVEATR